MGPKRKFSRTAVRTSSQEKFSPPNSPSPLQNASKSPGFTKEKCYLSSLFHRLRTLIALNCSLIFVTDGSIPAIKLSTYRRRLGLGNEVTRDKSNLNGLSALLRNKGSGFSSMIKEAKLLGMALGIPCLNGLDKRLPWLHNECLILDGPSVEDGSNQQSSKKNCYSNPRGLCNMVHPQQDADRKQGLRLIEEAEAQCALLNFESLRDGCFTADSDVFLFGARTVYRDIYLGEGGYVLCYEMADIERKLGLGRNSLISLALLLGGDYSQGVHGIGQETACQIIKSMGDNLVLQKIASEGFAIVKKTKGAKKQGLVIKGNADKENRLDKQNVNDSIQNAGSDHQFLQVIDAYLKPECHSPDSAAVQSVLVPHPFQRSQLQMVCAQFFGWTPEKTDEYVLPKIAEKDLRRFANLRNTSHELGVQIPLCKIPAKCPVSAIVKKRKVQGRECFEVAWEEVDGLITSTVPADLVESACPEKIVEYMERREEIKQQKRKRKPNKKHQVHSPSIESDGHNASMCLHTVGPSEETNLIDLSTPSPPIRACKTTKCQETLASGLHEQLEGLLLGRESRSIDMPDATVCHALIGPSSAESEVIDLSTPLPPSHVCTKSGEAVSQSMDVIDSSELESDASPEHLRKARELRLFLNSIKDDLC